MTSVAPRFAQNDAPRSYDYDARAPHDVRAPAKQYEYESRGAPTKPEYESRSAHDGRAHKPEYESRGPKQFDSAPQWAPPPVPVAAPASGFMGMLTDNAVMIGIGVVLIIIIFVLIWWFTRSTDDVPAKPQVPARAPGQGGHAPPQPQTPLQQPAHPPTQHVQNAPASPPTSGMPAAPPAPASAPPPPPAIEPPTGAALAEAQSVDDDELMKFITA